MSGRDTMSELTGRIIEAIENGAGDWVMPWNSAAGLPANATTGIPYRGANVIALWIAALDGGFNGHQWATYKQWEAIGGQVAKGSTGTKLVRWVEKKKKKDDDKKVLLPVGFSVFHADQLKEPVTDTVQVAPLHEGNFAHVFDAIPANIRWGAGQPGYDIVADAIAMPGWDAFHTTAAAYSTLSHELAHWTGKRLNRDLAVKFGSDGYAIEELVAELSAAFTCASVGIEPAIRDDHAPYLAHWVRVLKADPGVLWSIASAAQAATDHLISYSTAEAVA